MQGNAIGPAHRKDGFTPWHARQGQHPFHTQKRHQDHGQRKGETWPPGSLAPRRLAVPPGPDMHPDPHGHQDQQDQDRRNSPLDPHAYTGQRDPQRIKKPDGSCSNQHQHKRAVDQQVPAPVTTKYGRRPD